MELCSPAALKHAHGSVTSIAATTIKELFLFEYPPYANALRARFGSYASSRMTGSSHRSVTSADNGVDVTSNIDRMSSKNSGSSRSSGSNSFTPYTVTGSGVNSQGNSYDTRSQPAGEAYHYSNSDGSYYYSNGDGSTYHNSASGGSTYTAPGGQSYRK